MPIKKVILFTLGLIVLVPIALLGLLGEFFEKTADLAATYIGEPYRKFLFWLFRYKGDK